MTPVINYVIGAYCGPRNGAVDQHASVYLREHLDSLVRLQHSITQITVVISGAAEAAILSALPTRVGTANVIVRQRPNVGLSYGAYADALEWYGDAFTHYLLTEDDYIFTQNNFDQILLEELGKHDRCGAMCGAAYRLGGAPKHAGVSITLCPTESLLEAAKKHAGRLPHGQGSVMSDGYFGQTAQSYALVEAGWSIEDWLFRYSSAFWNSEGRAVRWFSRTPLPDCSDCAANYADRYGPSPHPSKIICPHQDHIPGGNLDLPSFVVPIQALHCGSVQISDGANWHTGTINQDGIFSRESR